MPSSFWNLASSVEGILLLAEPGKGDDPILFCGECFGVLPDHKLEVIKRPLILTQTQVRHRPVEPGIHIVRLGLELLIGTSNATWTSSRGDRLVTCCTDHDIH